MKFLKWTLLVLVIAMVGMQVIRPERTNPPVDPALVMQAHTDMTPGVQAILERACYDCHTHETVWPWYSQVAPASWLVAHDVKEGRDEFSISTWGTYQARRANHKLEELCEMVESGEMPPWFYVIMHGDARLSEADKETLCAWSEAERARLAEAAAPMVIPDSTQQEGEMRREE